MRAVYRTAVGALAAVAVGGPGLLTFPAVAAAQGSTAPAISPVAPQTSPLAPGFPQPSVSVPSTSTPTPTVSTSATAGSGSAFQGSSLIVITIAAIAVLGGISFFIWRDARRRAPVRHRAAAIEGVGRRQGSKQRAKPRKLSPAERRRRKRGRAR